MQFWKWCVVLLCLSAQNVFAHEPGDSSLTFEVGADSESGQEAYLDLDTAMKNGMHIRWMSGGNRLDDESETFETRSRMIGISSDYSAPFVIGFEFDYWGNQDTVETRTRRLKAGFNSADWYLEFNYEARVTRFYLSGVLSLIADYAELDSSGAGLNISLFALDPFNISVSYTKYEFETFARGQPITALAGNRYAELYFSPATLGMATGLESWRNSLDLSYNFARGVVGISGSQSESAVDESLSSTGTVYLLVNINRSWSSTLSWGKSNTDTSDIEVTFFRAAVTHRW